MGAHVYKTSDYGENIVRGDNVKKNLFNFFRNKGFYLAIGICALAIVAVAGVISLQSDRQDEQLAENAAGFEDVPEDETDGADAVADNRTADNDYDLDYTEGYNADEVQEILDELQEADAAGDDSAVAANSGEVSGQNDDTKENTGDDAQDETQDTDAERTFAGFDETQKMSWPVQGDILLDYSMDTTVYYQTLDQYKCNPGVLIATDINTPVNAAFEGTVTSITNDAALGNVVVIDMGNGYQASYGQLKDITVNVGDTVSKGQAIASIAQPTKYFGEEGSHLYFALTKDGAPTDPKPLMA